MKTSRQSSPSVLVVDDCPITRDVVLMLLKHDGLVGVAVSSLEEALQMLSRRRFDIVLSDYDLSRGETGFELLAEVRQMAAPARPAFILMSSWRREDLDPEARYLRGVPFIDKPFDVAGFRRAIAAVVQPARVEVLSAS